MTVRGCTLNIGVEGKMNGKFCRKTGQKHERKRKTPREKIAPPSFIFLRVGRVVIDNLLCVLCVLSLISPMKPTILSLSSIAATTLSLSSSTRALAVTPLHQQHLQQPCSSTPPGHSLLQDRLASFQRSSWPPLPAPLP